MLKDKLPFILINTLLLHIPLLALTDGQNDWRRDKYTCYPWAGGPFFQLCCCVSFLVVVEIVLGDTYLPYQLCCCVFFVAAGNSFWLHRSVFWLWREIVLGVTSLPIVPYQLCRCVSFFVAAGNNFWLLSHIYKRFKWQCCMLYVVYRKFWIIDHVGITANNCKCP